MADKKIVSAPNQSAAIIARPINTMPFEDLMGDKRVLGQLKNVLPPELTVAKMAQTAIILFRGNQYLRSCQAMTILGSLIEVAQLGFELDKVRGQAYLVPYKTVCTMICGYKGYITLAMRTGAVRNVTAEIRHAGEEFQILYGAKRNLYHSPTFPQSDKEDDWLGVYACLTRTNDDFDFEYLDAPRVHQYRSKSMSFNSDKKSPWKDMPDKLWMWKKTAIRQLMHRTDLSVIDRRLPPNQNPARVAALDDMKELGLVRQSPELSDLGTEAHYTTVDIPNPQEGPSRISDQEQEAAGNGSTQGAGGTLFDIGEGASGSKSHVAAKSSSAKAADKEKPKAKGKPITKQECDAVFALAQDIAPGYQNTKSHVDKILKHFKLSKVQDITQDEYQSFMNMVRDGIPPR